MLKKRVIDSLKAFYARISAYSPLTKIIFIMILASLVISIGYTIRILTHKAQVAEITEIVVTPPFPPPTGINIQTPSTALYASNLQIMMGNNNGQYQIIGSYNELPSYITPFSTNSVTDPNHTTLEAYWEEGPLTFHVYLYFEAFTQSGVGPYWHLMNAKVLYNSTTWLDLTSNTSELYANYPIGTSLYLSTVDLTTTNGNPFIIRLSNLNLQAFINETNFSPYPSPSLPPNSPSPSPSIPPTCVRQAPLISSFGPWNGSGLPGSSTAYSIQITNQDTQACGSSLFSLATQVPSDFTVQGNQPTLWIPAGATAQTTFTLVAPLINPWNEERTVPISYTATNTTSNIGASVTASFTLLMPQPQTFNMLFKLAGVTNDSAEGTKVNVKFYLKNGTVRALSEPLTLVSAGQDGYQTSVTISNPFPPGTEFRVKVKGEKHIAIEFCKAYGQTGPCGDDDYILISPNEQNSYKLSLDGIPLPPGDLYPQDGKANLEDLSKLKPLMGKPQSSLTDADLVIGDVNYDNFINIYDVFLILKTVETRYDD